MPQAAAEVALWQTLFAQQPVAQVVALQVVAVEARQVPAVQVWPLEHVLHVKPLAPHALGDVPARHTPFEQHPLPQVVASHAAADEPQEGATALIRPSTAPRPKALYEKVIAAH